MDDPVFPPWLKKEFGGITRDALVALSTLYFAHKRFHSFNFTHGRSLQLGFTLVNCERDCPRISCAVFIAPMHKSQAHTL